LQADVIVIQLANGGVILSDGKDTSIMIDGMVAESYSIYAGLPNEAATQLLKAAGPFSGIDLALSSHQHHHHNQPVAACSFLQKSPGTKFTSSAQVIDLLREKCRQFVTGSQNVQVIDPQYDQPVMLQAGDATVTIFLLSHGGGRNSVVKNFGHLVEIGGMRVLHLGGADMNPTDFARAGVDKMKVDVALIPFLFFQPGPGRDIVSTYLNVPNQIADQIPPGEMAEVKSYMLAEYPDVLILDDALEQVRFTAAAPPPQ
jgi:L-ascorbate metabolism protein UlaG (beta-lactamase superfamily)